MEGRSETQCGAHRRSHGGTRIDTLKYTCLYLLSRQSSAGIFISGIRTQCVRSPLAEAVTEAKPKEEAEVMWTLGTFRYLSLLTLDFL